jgi:UPF0755 protein
MKKFFTIIAAALIVFFGIKGIRWYMDNKAGNLTGPTEVYVYPDSTPEDVLSQLSANVRRPKSLNRMFKKKRLAEYMQVGHYSFDRNASSVFIVRSLNNAWQTPVNLTLSGSLRLKGEIARKISAQMLLDSAYVADALQDAALLKEYGFTPATVFALFIPDTYEIYWTASMKDILDDQKAAYDAFWTEENIAKARSLGLSPMEVSILASIVKGESKVQSEFSKIAGVYLNRLRRGMRLQADPTIAFCFDYTPNRILKKHLLVDSPYNTYKHAGLPPGPICVPDKAYLEAVLNPSVSENYLYFCASPSFDGTHRFARSYAEHARNAREFQKALSRSKP